MKLFDFTRQSKKWHIAAGLLSGAAVLFLCFCFAVISAVSSSSVYTTALKKGAVDANYDIDSDNYAHYYTVLTEFLNTNDQGIIENAIFRANGRTQPVFSGDDFAVLKDAGNLYMFIRIAAALLTVFLILFIIIVLIKKGKHELAIISSWACVSFLTCAVLCAAAVGVAHACGGSLSDGLFRALTLGGITDYAGGNLMYLYGDVTRSVFTQAVYSMSGLFGAIALAVTIALSRLGKKHTDLLDDYMYQ